VKAVDLPTPRSVQGTRLGSVPVPIGYDLDTMRRFVIGVESQFYLDIEKLYIHRIREWAAAKHAELGLDVETET
jgi:hypothetical protein